MPSKLRKAIAVVKDQTSISLAKVSNNNSSHLDVAVLKATTHDEVIEDRHVHEVVVLTSSSPRCASACVHALARRLARTKNWMVALKCLTLTFKILQQGDTHFAQEVPRTMKRGTTILNLSNFCDDSNSSPWDYTAFVRTFALYIEERLGCSLVGKLHEWHCHGNQRVPDMKVDVLLDRMANWQRLLDRVLATRPTGSARSNRLVQSSLHSVVRESFGLYRDIADGLTVLLENFLQLQRRPSVEAAHICIRASKQFDELAEFYTLCKRLGIGSRSEYPSVKKISEKVLETLETFLKDDEKSHHRGNSKGEPEFPLRREESMVGLHSPYQNMEEKRELGSQIRSPEEDFKDANETNASMSSLGNQDSFNDLLDMTNATDTCEPSSRGGEDDLFSLDSSSDIVLFEDRNKQRATQKNNSCMDLALFNEDLQQPPQQPGIQQSISAPYSGLDLGLFDNGWSMSQQEQQLKPTSPSPITTIAEEGCWEMVLAETSSDANQVNHSGEGWELSHLDNFHHYQNPFLQGGGESNPFAIPQMGSLPSPTFNAKNPDQASRLPPEADPFSHLYCMASPTHSHSYDISSAKSPVAIH